jgi:hypothetical protein
MSRHYSILAWIRARTALGYAGLRPRKIVFLKQLRNCGFRLRRRTPRLKSQKQHSKPIY